MTNVRGQAQNTFNKNLICHRLNINFIHSTYFFSVFHGFCLSSRSITLGSPAMVGGGYLPCGDLDRHRGVQLLHIFLYPAQRPLVESSPSKNQLLSSIFWGGSEHHFTVAQHDPVMHQEENFVWKAA